MISAKIVADSLSPQGHRLTSLIVVMPRIVLAEFNTHRALSKNSASSRAIPFKKMVKSVTDNPFIPIAWQKDHSGMQGTEYFSEQDLLQVYPDGHKYADSRFEAITHLTNEWLAARDAAVLSATHLNKVGLTKQLCNRLLEPFLYHTVLVSGTEWSNFIALRLHGAAEIHINQVAVCIHDAMINSTPRELQAGEWHIPFGDNIKYIELANLIEEDESLMQQAAIKIATARCARLSYKTLGDEPKIDYAKDIELHDMLLTSGHMSPFEHCAKAMSSVEYNKYYVHTPADLIVPSTFSNNNVAMKGASREVINGICGNFRGFVQYRKMIPNESR